MTKALLTNPICVIIFFLLEIMYKRSLTNADYPRDCCPTGMKGMSKSGSRGANFGKISKIEFIILNYK